MEHPQARAKGRDLKTDGPGTTFDRKGPGRHAMEKQVSPKEHEARYFAREVANRLELEGQQGSFTRLVIAAAPGFLGHLRRYLSTEVRDLVAEELAKDLVHGNPDKVRRSLPSRL